MGSRHSECTVEARSWRRADATQARTLDGRAGPLGPGCSVTEGGGLRRGFDGPLEPILELDTGCAKRVGFCSHSQGSATKPKTAVPHATKGHIAKERPTVDTEGGYYSIPEPESPSLDCSCGMKLACFRRRPANKRATQVQHPNGRIKGGSWGPLLPPVTNAARKTTMG